MMPRKPPSDRKTAIGFALAKVHNDLGEYRAAIRYCLNANALLGHTYAPLHVERYIAALERLHRAGDFAGLPDSGVTDERPLFIVGMPRSGTTLVETILSRHPKVRAMGEMPDIGQAAARLQHLAGARLRRPADQIEALRHADPGTLRGLAEAMLARVDAQKGPRYKIFTDKMPGNALLLPVIAKLFSGARIVYVRRDPLDCCISNLFAMFGPAHAYATRMDWLAAHYLSVEKAMDLSRRIVALPVLEVAYETLVGDPEPQVRRLLEFAGLAWDPACLSPQATARALSTASVWQARQPINAASVERWRHYEPWIQPLIEGLGGYAALGKEPGTTQIEPS